MNIIQALGEEAQALSNSFDSASHLSSDLRSFSNKLQIGGIVLVNFIEDGEVRDDFEALLGAVRRAATDCGESAPDRKRKLQAFLRSAQALLEQAQRTHRE